MELAITLLKEYQNFARDTGSDSLAAFGDWLKRKYAAQTETAYQTDKPEVNAHGVDVMVGFLLGTLTSYTEAWIKLAYEETPLVSIIDFAILKTVESRGSPSKKEIAEAVIKERTTSIESIKRLISEGLLSEETDRQDKRLKRVKLTKKGSNMILILNNKMAALGKLLVGDLTEEEKKHTLLVLNKLNRFHDHLYRQWSREDVKKKFQL